MKKALGFWRSWALVVGTMIGSGVFLLPSVLAPYGSNSAWGWIAAGAGTLFIALSLGSLARVLPRIGGPYAYTKAAFGDLPAFLIAWGYWVAIWAAIAAIAVAFTGYLGVFVPALKSTPIGSAVATLAVIWLFAVVNISGVRSAGVVQLITTILKILPLLAVGALGMTLGDVTTIPAENPDNQAWPMLIASMVMLTMWAFVGMEAATIPADDVENPARTIPMALITGVLTATAVYMISTLGVMALVPPSQLASSSSPFSFAASTVIGNAGAQFIGIGALVSIAGALNSNVLLSGQVPRAAALDALFPQRFACLNSRHAPATGIIVSCLLASILVGLNYTKGLVAAFTTMILLSTLTTLIPYAASAAADLVLQCRAGKRLSATSMVVALLALLFSLFTIAGSGLDVIGYGLVLLLAGVPVYVFMRQMASMPDSSN